MLLPPAFRRVITQSGPNEHAPNLREMPGNLLLLRPRGRVATCTHWPECLLDKAKLVLSRRSEGSQMARLNSICFQRNERSKHGEVVLNVWTRSANETSAHGLFHEARGRPRSRDKPLPIELCSGAEDAPHLSLRLDTGQRGVEPTVTLIKVFADDFERQIEIALHRENEADAFHIGV